MWTRISRSIMKLSGQFEKVAPHSQDTYSDDEDERRHVKEYLEDAMQEDSVDSEDEAPRRRGKRIKKAPRFMLEAFMTEVPLIIPKPAHESAPKPAPAPKPVHVHVPKPAPMPAPMPVTTHQAYKQGLEVRPEAPTRAFNFHHPPPAIHFSSGEAVAPHDLNLLRFHERSGATGAAQGTHRILRLVGSGEVSFQCTEETYAKLLRPVKAPTVRRTDSTICCWDRDGEPANVGGILLPIGSIFRAWEDRALFPVDDRTSEFLTGCYAMQLPDSPWKMPVARVLISPATSVMDVDAEEDAVKSPGKGKKKKGKSAQSAIKPDFKEYTATVHVYFGRLVFELIACDHIKSVLSYLRPSCPVAAPVLPLPEMPKLLTSHVSKEAARDRSYKFSIQGILKAAEHTGYREERSEDIQGLKLELLPYQRQTLAWMLDQETVDLNRRFWEERRWPGAVPGAGKAGAGSADCVSFYYFPAAGEVRIDRPPRVHGGLLAEEMGLGKTCELLALVLRDRELRYPHRLPPSETTTQRSNGTLVVVPVTLLAQWEAEIAKTVEPGLLRIATYHGETQIRKWQTKAEKDKGRLALERVGLVAPESDEGEDDARPNKRARVPVQPREERVAEVKRLIRELAENDIVLTSYSTIESESGAAAMKSGAARALFTTHWRRIVLDECQEIRSSTTVLARQCAALSSDKRWMMSGTPLHNSISDLNGELAFLQVIPFSLSDTIDGFWGAKMARPLEEESAEALSLLHSLIRATMVRHSKSQTYADSGRSLLALPPAHVALVPIRNTGSDLYIQAWLEHAGAEAIERIGVQGQHLVDPVFGGGAQRSGRHVAERVLRLQREVCTAAAIMAHPIVEVRGTQTMRGLGEVNDLMRFATNARDGRGPEHRGNVVHGIPLMSPEEAIEVLMKPHAVTAREAEMVRHADNAQQQYGVRRQYAMETVESKLGTATHRHEALTRDLQVAKTELCRLRWRWAVHRITSGAALVSLARCSSRHLRRLAGHLTRQAALGKARRVLERVEARCRRMSVDEIAEALGQAVEYDEEEGVSDRVFRELVKRFSQAELAAFEAAETAYLEGQVGAVDGVRAAKRIADRLEEVRRVAAKHTEDLAALTPYLTLLRRAITAGGKHINAATLEQSGFESLNQMADGGKPECLICMQETDEPCIISRCLHGGCRECIVGWLRAAHVLAPGHNPGHSATCPCCRKQFFHSDLISIKIPSAEEVAAKRAEEEARRARGDLAGAGPGKQDEEIAVDESDADEAGVDRVGPFKVSSTFSWERLNALPLPPRAQMQPEPTLPALSRDLLANLRNALEEDHLSAKLRRLLDDLRVAFSLDGGTGKAVVFSQFPRSLDYVASILARRGIQSTLIKPGQTDALRREALQTWNQDPEVRVLLLHVGAAAAGLTLTRARTLIILEPLLNSGDEAQCRSRIHRLGQSKEVFCFTYFIDRSVEERILAHRFKQQPHHFSHCLVTRKPWDTAQYEAIERAPRAVPAQEAAQGAGPSTTLALSARGGGKPGSGGRPSVLSPSVVVVMDSDDEEDLVMLVNEDEEEDEGVSQFDSTLLRVRFLLGMETSAQRKARAKAGKTETWAKGGAKGAAGGKGVVAHGRKAARVVHVSKKKKKAAGKKRKGRKNRYDRDSDSEDNRELEDDEEALGLLDGSDEDYEGY